MRPARQRCFVSWNKDRCSMLPSGIGFVRNSQYRTLWILKKWAHPLISGNRGTESSQGPVWLPNTDAFTTSPCALALKTLPSRHQGRAAPLHWGRPCPRPYPDRSRLPGQPAGRFSSPQAPHAAGPCRQCAVPVLPGTRGAARRLRLSRERRAIVSMTCRCRLTTCETSAIFRFYQMAQQEDSIHRTSFSV